MSDIATDTPIYTTQFIAPDLSVFDTVPQYLTDYAHLVDTDISPRIRKEIERIDSEYVAERMTCQQFHDAFRRVLLMYQVEKPLVTCPTPTLLAILFLAVTKRTKIGAASKKKGKTIPYYGIDTFIYPITLGHAPQEVADISWRLTTGEGLPEKFKPSTVVEIFRVVKQIAKTRTDLSMRQVYEEVIQVTKSYDTSGQPGLPGGWSDVLQDAIYAHFNIEPQLPRGQRRNRVEKAQATKPEKKSEVVPEMKPVKKKKDRTRKEVQKEQDARSNRPTFAEEQQITCELRSGLERLIQLRVESFSDENQILVQEQTIGMMDDALYYLNAACNRITRQQRTLDKLGGDVLEMKMRAEYEEACQFFGYDLGPGENVDYDAFIKSLYKQQSFDYHPDRHPEHLEKYLTLQKHNEVIITFNERYGNKS